MQGKMKKLTVIGLQQTFLQMVYEQITDLTRGKLHVRTVSLNDLDENPLALDETILYFSRGLKTIVERMFPECKAYLYARRENLIYNMRDLFALESGQRILVVNDVKTNTDEMTADLKGLGLNHHFFPYYPDEPLPEGIDQVVTAGERMLVPTLLKDTPLIDIGLRFISLESVFALFDHFKISYTHATLARHYMRTVMMLSEKWPVLGENRYRRPAWFGIRQDTSALCTFDDLIQNSEAMKAFCRDAKKIAATDKPIHLYGRTGTGKIRISQAIHNASAFKNGPFISINCAARPMDALERELFGWEDARVTHKSLFETAENGTLCIEEIGKLPEKLQAGLLQAVTEKKIIRSNGSGVVQINVRLITTASQRLDEAPQGFNSNLLFMITQHFCRVPQLKDRMADFEALVVDYLENGIKKPHLQIPRDTMDALKIHVWEGNVQELYNVLQHVICMSEKVLEKKNLPYYITKNAAVQGTTPGDQEKKGNLSGENQFSSITLDLTTHGFLEETRQILKIYQAGKDNNHAYGRGTVLNLLASNGFNLSQQQLRLKLERMDKLGLLIVRPGRGGTTISEKGEHYLKALPVKDL